MQAQELEFLKYPTGKFTYSNSYNSLDLAQFIQDIELFPSRLEQAVTSFNDTQLDTPYRPDGWTVRQLTHHCADSHMNSLIRLKLALTEENPTVKPYAEALWAELIDSKLPIESSMAIIKATHLKWVLLLKHMGESQFERTFFHPEKQKSLSLFQATALYAWHCKHHLAHITNLALRENW